MTMHKISQDVLDVLITKGIDKDQIIADLVKLHPHILLQLLHHEDLPFQIQLAYQSTSHDDRPNKVTAIKKYRELTGVGLKDAKDAVEAMIDTKQITARGQYKAND